MTKDERIAELEREVAEKDKEIGKLLAGHLEKCFVDFKRDHDKKLRHEICEKIKKKLCRIEDTLINLGNGKEDALNYFVKILNEIEQGEE